MTLSRSALSSCRRLKPTSALTSVPALLASTPGVSRKSRELRSNFSATTRFSRRCCATTGAGMPCASYSPVRRSKPGVSSVSLFGSVMAKPGTTLLKTCHAAAGASSQKGAWLASASVATLSHGTSCTPPPSAASGRRTTSGTNGSKTQRRAGSRSRRSNSLRTARSFLRRPDGVVPQYLAGAAFHHLRADIERREQRIERRGRGVLQEAFVESTMFDPAALATNMPVLQMDLRGLREARELLVSGLRGDDAGRVFVEGRRPM